MEPLINQLDGNIKIILYILLLNFFITLIYLGWSIWKKDYYKGVMMSLLLLLIPIVGPLYLGISILLYKFYFKNRREIVSIKDLSFSKEKIETLMKDNMETALNKVPLEEALEVSNVQNTRRLLLNVLKEDTDSYIPSINQATANPDSEVSHYAATAMTDIINKFKQNEKKLKSNYEQNPEEPESALLYWKHLSEFLQTGVLPPVEQERYFNILEKLTVELESDERTFLSGETYHTLTNLSLALDKPARAKVWVEQAFKLYPDDLSSYKAGLKYYYETKQFEHFKELLEKLKGTEVSLDYETLELVRFYS